MRKFNKNKTKNKTITANSYMLKFIYVYIVDLNENIRRLKDQLTGRKKIWTKQRPKNK